MQVRLLWALLLPSLAVPTLQCGSVHAILHSCARADKLKRGAEDKTSEAIRTLNEKHDFCGKKLAELQRQVDLRQNEIKELLGKGQKEKAKTVLKRKKILEKQMEAVSNVRASNQTQLALCAPITSGLPTARKYPHETPGQSHSPHPCHHLHTCCRHPSTQPRPCACAH